MIHTSKFNNSINRLKCRYSLLIYYIYTKILDMYPLWFLCNAHIIILKKKILFTNSLNSNTSILKKKYPILCLYVVFNRIRTLFYSYIVNMCCFNAYVHCNPSICYSSIVINSFAININTFFFREFIIFMFFCHFLLRCLNFILYYVCILSVVCYNVLKCFWSTN